MSTDNKALWKQILLVVVILLVLYIASVFFNTKKENDGVVALTTTKNADDSKIIGNLYRNTKYNFRIRFPENWIITEGDGIHIVQKAVSESGTMSIVVQKFDSNTIKFDSIKDSGDIKEFSDDIIESVAEKFSNVKLIDYGETKIDNEPAYWIEYSATYQALDKVLTITDLVFYLAKGDTFYSIDSGAMSDKYMEVKPIIMQSVSSFVLEN